MLVRILTDQVQNLWPAIKHGLKESLPPTVIANEQTMANTLAALLSGEMIAFAAVQNNDVYAIVILSFIWDNIVKEQSLLVFSLFAYRHIDDEMWQQGFAELRAFAKANFCNKIVAYSQNERILDLVNDLGGSTAYRYIELEVD